MDKKNLLTYQGLQKLESELQDLKVVKRKEIAQKIKEAREQGDLSENAEYDAAKDEQRDIEARIEEIEKIFPFKLFASVEPTILYSSSSSNSQSRIRTWQPTLILSRSTSSSTTTSACLKIFSISSIRASIL